MTKTATTKTGETIERLHFASAGAVRVRKDRPEIRIQGETYDDVIKRAPAYLDAHSAAFCGLPIPAAKDQFEQQAIDRGEWDGRKAREKALAEMGA